MFAERHQFGNESSHRQPVIQGGCRWRGPRPLRKGSHSQDEQQMPVAPFAMLQTDPIPVRREPRPRRYRLRNSRLTHQWSRHQPRDEISPIWQLPMEVRPSELRCSQPPHSLHPAHADQMDSRSRQPVIPRIGEWGRPRSDESTLPGIYPEPINPAQLSTNPQNPTPRLRPVP